METSKSLGLVKKLGYAIKIWDEALKQQQHIKSSYSSPIFPRPESHFNASSYLNAKSTKSVTITRSNGSKWYSISGSDTREYTWYAKSERLGFTHMYSLMPHPGVNKLGPMRNRVRVVNFDVLSSGHFGLQRWLVDTSSRSMGQLWTKTWEHHSMCSAAVNN